MREEIEEKIGRVIGGGLIGLNGNYWVERRVNGNQTGVKQKLNGSP
ncbi:hypothetical protein M145_3063, partial [Bacteroides fragilis str. 34-F-2 